MEQPRKKGRFASKKQIKRTEIVRQSQLTRWGGKQGEELVNSTSAQSFQDDFIADDILSTPEVVYSENVSVIYTIVKYICLFIVIVEVNLKKEYVL